MASVTHDTRRRTRRPQPQLRPGEPSISDMLALADYWQQRLGLPRDPSPPEPAPARAD